MSRCIVFLHLVIFLLMLTGAFGSSATDFNDNDFGDVNIDDGMPIASDLLDLEILENSTESSLQSNSSGPVHAIIGGWEVAPHKYPFIVSLQLHSVKTGEKNFHFCAGSLISSVHVLTAAHCLTDVFGKANQPANTFHVGIGLHNRKPNNNAHYFKVKRIQIHHGFRGQLNKFLDDIALLTLSSSVARRRRGQKALNARAIALPTGPKDDVKPGQTVRAVGWGLTREYILGLTNTTPLRLMGAQFTVISPTECAKRLTEELTVTKLCIDSSKTASCKGDSGGPLFRQLRSGKFQLVGIASYFNGNCRQAGSANVFTRVSHYTEWVRTAMRNPQYT
ncbi:putative Chymotrypsinogen A [Hypsibius exemplaris]|uniref:Chymotrypsinogen A n=1 Tax=Hypsibius exemplaris TaxID=2072580 RepID=A0A9X6RN83_HYPEX|nr:putative Chymotrypsinogen A [Hypsibius exemplaris]